MEIFLWLFNPSEVPLSGVKTGGVKGISLKNGDKLVCGLSINDNSEYLLVCTNSKTGKRIKISDLLLSGRAKRGNALFKKTKTVVYELLNIILVNAKDEILMNYDTDIKMIKASDIPIMDISSTGSVLSKTKVDGVYKKAELTVVSATTKKETKVAQESMDDFLESFKL